MLDDLLEGWECPNPECGGEHIEEVMSNVTVVSRLAYVGDGGPGDIRYDTQTNEDGEVDRYQCEDCGRVIADNEKDLVAVLKAAKDGTARTSLQRLMKHAEEIQAVECSLDEVVHDAKGNEAAAINNGGLEAQIHYLLECGVPEAEIKDSLIPTS